MSEPDMVRFHSSCSSFCTSPLGHYSSCIITFRFSQPIAFAIRRVNDLTWLFHHVRALSEKVQVENLTLLSSGHTHNSKIDSVFSNPCIREMTPPIPSKDMGPQVMKYLYDHSLVCPWLKLLVLVPDPPVPLALI